MKKSANQALDQVNATLGKGSASEPVGDGLLANEPNSHEAPQPKRGTGGVTHHVVVVSEKVSAREGRDL